MSASLAVTPATEGLRGEVRPPGDKSISHRALLLGALAGGVSRLSGLSDGADVAATAAAIEAFGAGVASEGGGTVVVTGGRSRLHEPAAPVDVGNSGTGIRLLAGWCAGIDGLTVLHGDSSVNRRPMGRVVSPLRAMGARVDGRAGGELAPLAVRGGGLTGIDVATPVASAQVKGAILIAGLAADGATTVREPVPTRRHTEELLVRFGADVVAGPGWATVRPSELHPADVAVPADPSQAAFWVVAATVVPGSELVLPRVYTGPGRSGFLRVLRRMGADIEVTPLPDEPGVAGLVVRSAELRGTVVAGEEVPDLIDEVPVLAVAAAFADGATSFRDAGELRVKESDRIATTVAGLRAVGVEADGAPDGLTVRGLGGGPLPGGEVASAGDHRIAMAFAVAGMRAARGVTIAGWDAVSTSYPSFEEDLRRCVS